MAPSQVNDALRAIMAAVAKWRDDLSGNLVTGGTSSAYTLTTNQIFASLTDGLYVRCRLNATNAANATLNVDGTGAKTIATVYGKAIRASTLLSGRVMGFTYEATDDKWIADAAPGEEVPTGSGTWYHGSTAPDGYVLASGRTIGNASSSATERANADCADLFARLWDSHSNTELPIQDSAGSATTRGANAAADFAANKRLPLPHVNGRTLIGKDDMGGTAANRVTSAGSGIDGATLGASGGAQTVTILQANLPNVTLSGTTSTDTHNHDISANRDISAFGAGSSKTAVTSLASGTSGDQDTNTGNDSHSHTVTVSLGGSGTALNKMPPALVANYIIKL